MKIPSFLLTACLGLTTISVQAQSPHVINDDLEVTGTLDIGGNDLGFGSLAASPATAGLHMNFSELALLGGIKRGVLTQNINHPSAQIDWRLLNSAGTAYDTILNLYSYAGQNTLRLYEPGMSSSTERVIFQTGSTGGSQIPGALTVRGSFHANGATNLLPGQTLNNSASIITMTLGDNRYLRRDGTNLTYGTGSSALIPGGSIALGDSSIAYGSTTEPSIAIGEGAKSYVSNYTGLYNLKHGGIAIGNHARAGDGPGADGGGIAIGSMSYSNDGAIAIGRGTIAGGTRSIAMGEDTRAYGYPSIAIGNNNITGGNGSALFGHWLHNNGAGTTVVGFNNLVRTEVSQTVYQPDGYAFIVGNGVTARSDAFTIQWDGDAWLQGNFATDKGLTVAEGASIGGNATVEGDISVDGEIEGTTAKFSDTVRIEPRGGLSMGEFTHDPDVP